MPAPGHVLGAAYGTLAEIQRRARKGFSPLPDDPGSSSEFAGSTFSPDGQTFSVNIQNPGITYAIWGPFKCYDDARQRRMGVAATPKSLAPEVSGELSEAATRYGLGAFEAA